MPIRGSPKVLLVPRQSGEGCIDTQDRVATAGAVEDDADPVQCRAGAANVDPVTVIAAPARYNNC
jgi:hypothetical protein